MTDLQATVLRAVSTGDTANELGHRIGRQPGHESNRQHSALIVRELRALEKAGLVRRLDEFKPVLWCRVER